MAGEPAGVSRQPRIEFVRRKVLRKAVLLEIRDPLDAAELQPRRRSHQEQIDFIARRPGKWPWATLGRPDLDARTREPLQPRIAGGGLQFGEDPLIAADDDQPRLLRLWQQAKGADEVAHIVDPAGPGLLVGVAQPDRQAAHHQRAAPFSLRRNLSSFSPCRLQT